jgi:hypothetical protein
MLPLLSAADDKWLEFDSGPFQIVTNAGEKPGREVLNKLEQLRYTLGAMLGKQDLKTLWPIRILVLKPGKQAVPYPAVKLARDSYAASLTAVTPETMESITQIFIDSNAGRMAEGIEHGLVELFSTLDVDGTRVSIGIPPAAKDRDWSRVHLLTVDPAYAGRLRVLLGNLQQGVDPEPAYKNAFEKTPEQIEEQLNRYIEAGNYGTTALSGRPLDPRRQLYAKSAEPYDAAVLQADVLLANNAGGAREAYASLLKQKPDAPEPNEGLGLLALRASKTAEARAFFDAAVKDDTHSARALVEQGRLATDPAQKKTAFSKAAQLNPRWEEPLILQAELEPSAFRKVPLLKTVTQLAPRNAEYWRLLAETQEAANQFVDAGKSWGFAERATGSPRERAVIHQARLQGEEKRLDLQVKEKEEARRKLEQETQDLKNRALADIRAFEAKANQGQAPMDPKIKLEEYKEEKPVVLSGMLVRVDCLGAQAKLFVQGEDKKVKHVLVRDPSKIVIRNGGEKALGCGAQNPARPLTIESKSGEVSSIEFR